MKALVVDDSRAMRSLLGLLLRKLGFEVYEAGDGAQAMDCLAHVPHLDLALVDWNMPVMTGYDFVKKVRSDATFNSLRIMMVTTESEQSKMEAALKAGSNEYIIKPFSRDAIREKLVVMGLVE